MPVYKVPVWKEAPFIRLLAALIAGILLQWYTGLHPFVYGVFFIISLATLFLFSRVRLFRRYTHYGIAGSAIHLLLATLGGASAYYQDIRYQPGYGDTTGLYAAACIAYIKAPVTSQQNFYKTVAVVYFLQTNGTLQKAADNVIIYFQKDATAASINHRTRIAFSKPLLPIADNGNPGSFNYRRYCAFQGIGHQVYLRKGDYRMLSPAAGKPVINFLYRAREKVVRIITCYVPGKKESGLAEALLIGYTNDLDKGLVRAYSNTGVVHVIAISGLHLGLIYWLLNRMCYPLGRWRHIRFLKPLIIIGGLWLFSMLAGGAPSVLRAAVMFTFIVAGNTFGRSTSIYNSLAGSAFLLLCYNPYWLWDAGFQLSYSAVLSIAAFTRPVYNWFFVQNKLLDSIWKGCAVSIAAQILTTPISIGLFHQFPNYFLVTNIVAVPLSGLIVLCEIALCVLFPVSAAAKVTGLVIVQLILLMNGFIEYMGRMPFAVTGQLQLSVPDIIIIYLLICAAGWWLLQKSKTALLISLCALGCFFIMRLSNRLEVHRQNKLIVYNVPGRQAIDLIRGGYFIFIGDTALQVNTVLENRYLASSRLLFHVQPLSSVPAGSGAYSIVQAGSKCIAIVRPSNEAPGVSRLTDCIILTGNPHISIRDLAASGCKLMIFDSSNTWWKVRQWKADCGRYGIRYYAVAETGAFILPLN